MSEEAKNEGPVNEEPRSTDRTWTEEIEVAGRELVDKVKELVREGNVRRVIIRKENGESILEIPLTAGVAVTGGIALFAPIWAALGAMAALLARLKIEVVRTEEKK